MKCHSKLRKNSHHIGPASLLAQHLIMMKPGLDRMQLAWLVASALLSFYLANFANYDATYGSLGAAIGFMTWLWISAIVILFGAELNSEIEHQTARDSTVGGEKPLGRREAAMADTVGAAADSSAA